MLCTVTAFADSGTYYQGYLKANLEVNDNPISEGRVPPFVIDGSTVVPLRKAAEALNALVAWDNDTKTAKLYRPNVNMFFSEEVSGKDYTIKKPFSRVDSGKTLSFVVFVQADSIKTTVDGFRISVIAPNGSIVNNLDDSTVYRSISDDSFWYTLPLKLRFSQTGTYTVSFSFLYNGDYQVVAEKTIKSE
jgi:hypothetical protein